MLLDEAAACVTRTGDTSPGTDKITVIALQEFWADVGEYIRALFEQCLRLGHHPLCWRQAEVVMIPKGGKRDLTSVRDWRPIALLSCLSKGLERLVAARLSYLALDRGVLHPNQVSALLKRSSTDLAVALTHDIESALIAGKVVTLTTSDIKGAFDSVLRNRMALRLREQGWAHGLVDYVHTFMSDRTARVRLQQTLTEPFELLCGLPQGSPLSPILFLLYTEPIYRLSEPDRRFGYADDVAHISVGNTLEETAARATAKISELTQWGRDNAV